MLQVDNIFMAYGLSRRFQGFVLDLVIDVMDLQTG
jgi:hypothetical protein